MSSTCVFAYLSVYLVCLFSLHSFFLQASLFIPSFVYLCDGVSICTTTSGSWLLIVLGSEVRYLPLGCCPTSHPLVFLLFYNLLSPVYRKQSSIVPQTLLLCLIACRDVSLLILLLYTFYFHHMCLQLMSELKLRVM